MNNLVSQTLSALDDNFPGSNFGQQLREIMSQETRRAFRPPLTVIDGTDTYDMFVDLPGVRPDDFKISFLNNTVTVKGTRHQAADGAMKTAEVQVGNFSRRIHMPFSVSDRANVDVTFQNGVLAIRVNKKAEAGERFEVRVGNGTA